MCVYVWLMHFASKLTHCYKTVLIKVNLKRKKQGKLRWLWKQFPGAEQTGPKWWREEEKRLEDGRRPSKEKYKLIKGLVLAKSCVFRLMWLEPWVAPGWRYSWEHDQDKKCPVLMQELDVH